MGLYIWEWLSGYFRLGCQPRKGWESEVKKPQPKKTPIISLSHMISEGQKSGSSFTGWFWLWVYREVQSSYWPGLQASDGSSEVGGFTSKIHSHGCWWEASVLHQVEGSTGLRECPHGMAVGFPQTECTQRERERRKPQCFFWPGLRGHTPSLLPYSILQKRVAQSSPHSKGGEVAPPLRRAECQRILFVNVILDLL